MVHSKYQTLIKKDPVSFLEIVAGPYYSLQIWVLCCIHLSYNIPSTLLEIWWGYFAIFSEISGCIYFPAFDFPVFNLEIQIIHNLSLTRIIFYCYWGKLFKFFHNWYLFDLDIRYSQLSSANYLAEIHRVNIGMEQFIVKAKL